MRAAIHTLSATAVIALALTACGAPDASTKASTTAERAVAAPTPAPTHSPTPSEGTDATVEVVDDCVVGEWFLDNESWRRATGSSYQSDGGTMIIAGEARMARGFDGTLTQVFDEWEIQYLHLGSTRTFTRDGTNVRLWTLMRDILDRNDTRVSATVLRVAELSEDHLEEDAALEVDSSLGESFRTSCDGQTMTAHTLEGTFTFTRQD